MCNYAENSFMWTHLPIHGPLVRYVNLWVAHALGMPGTFSPPPRVNDPDMHRGTCVMHVSWCMSGSLTSGFLWSRWRGKRFRHSRHFRHMHNPRFYVSGKRPIPHLNCDEPISAALSITLISVDMPLWSVSHSLDNGLSLVRCQAAS